MGKFRCKDTTPAQQDLWLRPEEIVTGPHNSFYTKLAALLEKVRFTETVHRICAPHDRLESGAVISAEIRHGDEGDTAGLADRIAEAAGKVEAIHGEDHDAGSSRVLELAADKGYHDATELAVIRHWTGMRSVIPDPSRGRRRMGKFAKEVRVALRAAQRAVASPSGRALLRVRGAHLERGFAHVIECGRLTSKLQPKKPKEKPIQQKNK